MKFFASALIGSSLLSAALALPAVLRGLSASQVPDSTAKLAFDDEAGLIYAYNQSGEKIGIVDPSKSGVQKRAGTCAPLSADDAQKIPGWSVITDQARASWGGGSYNLKTNIPEYPDSPANLCTSDSVAVISIDGQPACTKSAQSTQGQFQGTDGSVTLTNSYTETTSTSLTVTKTSSMGVSVTLSATVGIPEVVDITTGITTSLDITNTQSSSSSTSKTNTLTQSVTMQALAGQTCTLDFNTATCVAHGSGSIKYVASGWVWFAYDDKVDGHYFWALNMDYYLPNEDDRTSTINVDAVVNVDSTSDYNGACY